MNYVTIFTNDRLFGLSDGGILRCIWWFKCFFCYSGFLILRPNQSVCTIQLFKLFCCFSGQWAKSSQASYNPLFKNETQYQRRERRQSTNTKDPKKDSVIRLITCSKFFFRSRSFVYSSNFRFENIIEWISTNISLKSIQPLISFLNIPFLRITNKNISFFLDWKLLQEFLRWEARTHGHPALNLHSNVVYRIWDVSTPSHIEWCNIFLMNNLLLQHRFLLMEHLHEILCPVL